MSFVKLMYQAKILERRKRRLLREKQYAVALSEDSSAKPKGLLRCNIGRKLLELVKKCTSISEKSVMFKFLYKLRHSGSFENYILKSIVGFIGGFILTYIFFMFFVFQLNFTFSTATIMCSIFGSILTIGLAFSYNVRCIVFLTLPQLFSKRGRQALLAYAFILAITGPAKNTLNNMGILSESLACGQEQLKQAVKQILEAVKKPFYAIKDAIKTVVKVVKAVVKKIKEILLSIKRVIVSILKVLKSIFQFLARIINVCNKELGTPFQRCTRVFEDAVIDCHAKLGPKFSWLCSIAYVAQAVCYSVKMFDFICEIVDFIGNSIVGVVVKKVKQFIRHIKTMFYVRIRFSHSYGYQLNASKTMEDVAAGIVTEVKERTEGLMKIFDFMSCATSLFFIFMVVRVMYYRYKFLSDERFDNRFITKDFRAIDLRRAQLEKETVLPLNKRERHLYISVGSIRLVKKEKRKLSQAAVVLGIASLKLATHMIADYALFWVLTLIRRHASFESSYDGSNIPKININGTGVFADLLRSIVKAFQPVGINLEIDTVPCLPDPIPPDYDRYVQIASLLVICWFLAIFEPYGLRWRNSVMCFYHPLRAKQRAIWLYNHILRTRSSFLKFVRRQLRRKFGGDKSIAKVTCKEYINAYLSKFPVCHALIKPMNQTVCLLCGEIFREGDKLKPIRCQTPGCAGTYCEKCFQDLQNICTICLDPIQYGDLSDISEEKDSSEDMIVLKDQSTTTRIRKWKKKMSKRDKKKGKKRCGWYSFFSKRKQKNSDTEGNDSTTISSSVYSDSEPTTDIDTEATTFSYQFQKDVTLQQPVEIYIAKSSDIEQQKIPDYVTMDYYSSDKISSVAATFGSNTQYKQSKDSDVSKLSVLQRSKQVFTSQIKYFMEDDEDNIPLLDLDASTADDTDAKTDSTETTFIESTRISRKKSKNIKKKKNISLASSETTFIDTPINAASSKKFSYDDSFSGSYDSESTSSGENYTKYKSKVPKYDKRINVTTTSTYTDLPPPIDIPKLNLNFAECICDADPCTCRSSRTVYYYEESETQRSMRSVMVAAKLNSTRTPRCSTSSSSSLEYSGTRVTHRDTINYFYNTSVEDTYQAPKTSTSCLKSIGDWETLSSTTETDAKSYQDKVKSYYSKIGRVVFEKEVQVGKVKMTSRIRNFFRKLFKRDILDTPSASSSLTKSFLSESEKASSAGSLLQGGKLLPTKTGLRPTINFQYERGEEKQFQSGQLLFMGGGASKENLKRTSSTSANSESVIVGKTSFGKLSEEILVFNQKFGWYDSTDTDITELNENIVRKRKESDSCSKIDKKVCLKVDDSIEAKLSLKDVACTSPTCVDDSGSEDTTEEFPDFTDRDRKEEVFKVSVSTSTTDCLNCFFNSSEEPHPTITTTCVSHESTQTVSNSQMNIDKKRNSVDRYSREPPERDQNFDNGRYCTDHANCRCPCKPECKVTRPPDYQHSHSLHGQHRYHSPQHSSHMPQQNQHTPCPPLPHSMHSQSSYTNQYNQSYQEYQQFPSLQSSQSQPCSQGYKPSYSPNNQQQPRRGPPPTTTNFDRKRTTYDLAKSAENIRHSDHSKISSNLLQFIKNSIFNSVAEVGKSKMGKHDMTKSESSDNYCCNDYPNSSTHKYPYEEPNQDRDQNHDRNCACEYCHHMRRNYYRNCTCCECRKSPYEELSSFSEESQNISQNMKQRNYQKSDGYHRNMIPDELETTISQRNKERVRNTMRQFEMLSRQNKSLEKPIYDDEDDEEHCNMRHCPRNISPCFSRCNERCTDRCPDRCNIQNRNATLSTRSAFSATPFPRSKGYVEKVARYMDPSLSDNTQKYPKFNSEQTNSRWQMDPRTGEWYKVYDDGNYDFHNSYPPLPDPPMPQFQDQDGYNKGPSNSYYNQSSPMRNSSPNKHHHYPAHSKTCNCRNCTPHRY